MPQSGPRRCAGPSPGAAVPEGSSRSPEDLRCLLALAPWAPDWLFVLRPELRRAPGCREVSGAHMTRGDRPSWLALLGRVCGDLSGSGPPQRLGLRARQGECLPPSGPPHHTRCLLPPGLCSGVGWGPMTVWVSVTCFSREGFLAEAGSWTLRGPRSWRLCACSLSLPARDLLDLCGQTQQSSPVDYFIHVLPILRRRLLEVKGHKSTHGSSARHLVLPTAHRLGVPQLWPGRGAIPKYP